ncbi:nuclear transport factor 2 family protein [Salmonirosea aquatica]|uniref:SnoaL-like domain-containing protein n=1 Tax=Salmonirosea aquatica TaxID=2654236 RepID=A0A7C9BME4_9BACT|nr:hypothetical protein [Cytophagaceae bacterium SJW1-29]
MVGATFTPDAQVIKPNGAISIGHGNILDGQRKSFARFRATHHVTTDYIIDLDRDKATVRTNLTAMHDFGSYPSYSSMLFSFRNLFSS